MTKRHRTGIQELQINGPLKNNNIKHLTTTQRAVKEGYILCSREKCIKMFPLKQMLKRLDIDIIQMYSLSALRVILTG